MSTIALCLHFVDELGRLRSSPLAKIFAKIAAAHAVGAVFLMGTCASVETSYAYSAQPPIDDPIAIVSLPNADSHAFGETPDQKLNQHQPHAQDRFVTGDDDARNNDEARLAAKRKAFWSYGFFSAGNIQLKTGSQHKQATQLSEARLAARLVFDSREVRHFFAKYRTLAHVIATAGLEQIQQSAEATNAVIVGTASTYNPYLESTDTEDLKTASGEQYDPHAWTAAIQIKLRDQFRGVRFGRLYQPCYALIEAGDKKVIVKINDVGPLKPGRVIDLNERTMRYFDPNLQLGLVQDIKITPLPGEGWIPGPIGGLQLASIGTIQ